MTATMTHAPMLLPQLLYSEAELSQFVAHIDLLVIVTPNYMHMDTLLHWNHYGFGCNTCGSIMAASTSTAAVLLGA